MELDETPQATAGTTQAPAAPRPADTGEPIGLEPLGASGTAAVAHSYPVAPGYAVNVRSGPGTQYRVLRTLPVGAQVTVYCQRPGETVSGPYGTSKIWDNIGSGGYISDAYVKTGSDGYVASRCS